MQTRDKPARAAIIPRMDTLTLRDSRDTDIADITAIYAHAVIHGFGSFEVDPPSIEEMAARRSTILGRGDPYLVVTDAEDQVLGYAYVGPYRPRPAYRFTVEDSIYLGPGQQGRGIGRRLLSSLIGRSEARGYRRMVAVIGDSANHASIAMHAACGFEKVGVIPSLGWKAGRWVDSVLMQRPIGDGDATPPI
jgi:phosphinothricin acetyltransferase